jgi:hypothetical protein
MGKRGPERWIWAAVVALAGLVVPFLWPFVLLSAAARSRLGRRVIAVFQRMIDQCVSVEFRPVKVLVPLSLLVVVGAWFYSQLEPQHLGACHDIALYFGKHPTARDCAPYGATDLVIIVGVIMAFWILVTRGEVPLKIPGLPPYVLTEKQVKEAVAKEKIEGLRTDPDFDQRLDSFTRLRDRDA